MTGQEKIEALRALGDVFVIDSLETLRVVSDPLRLRILDLLRGEPRSVKQLAPDVGLGATKLYYHVNLLEQHGLIRVVETRVVSGIIEKRYRATARRLSVDRALLSPRAAQTPTDDERSPAREDQAGQGLDTLLAAILDGARSEIKRGVEAGLIDPSRTDPGEGGLLLGRQWLRMTPQQAQIFVARFKVSMEELSAHNAAPDDTTAQVYEILVGLYPTDRPPPVEEDRTADS